MQPGGEDLRHLVDPGVHMPRADRRRQAEMESLVQDIHVKPVVTELGGQVRVIHLGIDQDLRQGASGLLGEPVEIYDEVAHERGFAGIRLPHGQHMFEGVEVQAHAQVAVGERGEFKRESAVGVELLLVWRRRKQVGPRLLLADEGLQPLEVAPALEFRQHAALRRVQDVGHRRAALVQPVRPDWVNETISMRVFHSNTSCQGVGTCSPR